MCEANAYIYRDGNEELLLESVDIVEPEKDGSFRLRSIFGEQKIIKGKI
ncbi:MAG: CooT family nickel-binding protein, partial [Deltaproteobacteria bacterium]|nr:CooT family nickel-binding protein [Deltaproteobacteria bacterium]